MAEFHFRDNTTGACVQTLRVSHDKLSDAEVLADLQQNVPEGRTVVAIADDVEHVCETPAPTGDELVRQAKADRLAKLRDKGWAKLSEGERTEAQGLRFDLGL